MLLFTKGMIMKNLQAETFTQFIKEKLCAFFRSAVPLFILVGTLCSSVHADDAKTFLKVGAPISGFAGLTIDNDGNLIVCNAVYKNLLLFNPHEKKFIGTVFELPGFSFPDDVTLFSPNSGFNNPGGISISSFLDGRIWTRLNTGQVIESNPGPFFSCIECGVTPVTTDFAHFGANPIAYNVNDDFLYFSSVFNPTVLFKLDWRGTSPAQDITLDWSLANPPNVPFTFNAFSFNPLDGLLYAPCPSGGKVVKVDVNPLSANFGIVFDVVAGISNPIAVEVANNGLVYILSRITGKVLQFNTSTNILTEIATLEPPLDNIVINNALGKLYITNNQNTIFEVKADSGKTKILYTAPIKGPTDLAVDNDSVYIADDASLKQVDGGSAKIIRTLISDAEGSSLLGLSSIGGITVEPGKNGKIVLTDLELGNIWVINKKDFSLYDSFPSFPPDGTGLIGKQPFSAIRVTGGNPAEYYLAVNPVDNLILKFFRDGVGAIVTETFFSGLKGPVKLVQHGEHVYVVEAGDLINGVAHSGRVSRIKLVDHPTAADQQVLLDHLSEPHGLALFDDKMIVVEVGKKRLIQSSAKKFEHSPKEIFDDLHTKQDPLVSPFNPFPLGTFMGVAVNSDGSRIYVTERESPQILKIKR